MVMEPFGDVGAYLSLQVLSCIVFIAPALVSVHLFVHSSITKIPLNNFDPLKPHFYIVKMGFRGVCVIFLISAQKHRLWVLVRTASLRWF